MEVLQVGAPYVEGKTAWPEALEYNYTRGGHRLRIFLRTPSQEEITAIWKGDDTRFGLLVERDVIFLCFQFRHNDRLVFWGEAPYSWHFNAPEDRDLPDLAGLGPDMGWALSIILINAETGIIEGLRVMSFSHSFSVALAVAIRQQAAAPWDEAAYDTQLARIYEAYDSKAIWRFCSAKCKAGEGDPAPEPPTPPSGPSGPRFELGTVGATPGAVEALEATGEDPAAYLARHVSGDWGELPEEDKRENELSVKKGFRILSAYRLSDGVKIWVITEADRSATTFLLPSEY